MAKWSWQYLTVAQGSNHTRSIESSKLSIRLKAPVWEWGCLSVAQSSKRTADDSGQSQISGRALLSNSPSRLEFALCSLIVPARYRTGSGSDRVQLLRLVRISYPSFHSETILHSPPRRLRYRFYFDLIRAIRVHPRPILSFPSKRNAACNDN